MVRRMDTMGNAEELGFDEEVPPPRRPLLTPEALAVTSLVAAMASLLVSLTSQFEVFLLSDFLGLNNEGSQEKQFLLIMTPVGILAFIAALCAGTTLKRRSDNPWVGALALAGGLVGVTICLLIAAGVVVFLTNEPSSSNGGF